MRLTACAPPAGVVDCCWVERSTPCRRNACQQFMDSKQFNVSFGSLPFCTKLGQLAYEQFSSKVDGGCFFALQPETNTS